MLHPNLPLGKDLLHFCHPYVETLPSSHLNSSNRERQETKESPLSILVCIFHYLPITSTLEVLKLVPYVVDETLCV